jgi:hypothetical protein
VAQQDNEQGTLVAQFKITGAGVVHDKDGKQLTYEDGTLTQAGKAEKGIE